MKHFEDSVNEIKELEKQVLVSKHRDYGSRNILDCGEVGIIVRMNDKLARLKNLYGITDGTFKKKDISNESIEDSLLDLANYASIAIMVRRGTFDQPLRPTQPKKKGKKK